MSKLFILANIEREDEIKYLFDGPSHYSNDDFREICIELFPKAGKQLLEDSKDLKKQYYITVRDIYAKMVILLEEKGFFLQTPEETNFYLNTFIDNQGIEDKNVKSVFSKIAKQNNERNEKALLETLKLIKNKKFRKKEIQK